MIGTPVASAEARAWLDGEIEAGRLAPALDESQLAVIAGVLRAVAAPRKKIAAASTSAAIKEVRHASGASAES